MPWLSIAMWLLSFLLSKKKGASTAEAALLATGVAAATYYLADPSNESNLLGIGRGDGTAGTAKTSPGSVIETSSETGATSGGSTAGSVLGTIGSVADTAIKTTGSTLSSWGAAGTAGVIATTAAVNSGIDKKWLFIGGGVLLLLIATR